MFANMPHPGYGSMSKDDAFTLAILLKAKQVLITEDGPENTLQNVSRRRVPLNNIEM